jgi:hypothetical protein
MSRRVVEMWSTFHDPREKHGLGADEAAARLVWPLLLRLLNGEAEAILFDEYGHFGFTYVGNCLEQACSHALFVAFLGSGLGLFQIGHVDAGIQEMLPYFVFSPLEQPLELIEITVVEIKVAITKSLDGVLRGSPRRFHENASLYGLIGVCLTRLPVSLFSLL